MKKILLLFVVALILTNVIAQDCNSPVKRIIKKETNNKYTVEVFVDVSALDSIRANSFARLTEIIPEGSTCKVIESKGSDVKIINNEIKLIWLSLPSDKFSVKYELEFSAPTECLVMKGLFGYLQIGYKTKTIGVVDCK
jgi:hypothetical protein